LKLWYGIAWLHVMPLFGVCRHWVPIGILSRSRRGQIWLVLLWHGTWLCVTWPFRALYPQMGVICCWWGFASLLSCWCSMGVSGC
jgi:hypothetical protein